MFRRFVSLSENHFVRLLAAFICLSVFLMFAGCDLRGRDREETDGTPSDSSDITAVSASTTEEGATTVESIDPDPTTSSAETAVETTAESTTETTAETTTETTTEPSISNPENMYSSFAHMESFDPVTGWATFDYFDILKGQDAIDWLVAHEGYTVADATALVNDFADSEYVYKNVNPQLRTADMHDVTITMLYHADGTPMPGAETVPLTYAEFVTLYSGHSAYVLDSFFYYVTVSGGEITQVDQFYWP